MNALRKGGGAGVRGPGSEAQGQALATTDSTF